MKKPFSVDNGCESCQAVMINGVYCHETGCPDAWKNTTFNCEDVYYDRPCGDVDYDPSDRNEERP